MKSSRGPLIIVLGVIAVLVVALVAFLMYGIGLKNHLVELEENTKSAWAQVENQLQRRADLVPNLVETVKGYASHEEEVLTAVTRARASVGGARGQEEKIEANNNLTNALSRLLVVVERYPDLKANTNFLNLQDELAGTENRVAVERMRYNEVSRAYNTTLRKFPYSLMARSFEKVPYFEAAEGSKEAPKVKF